MRILSYRGPSAPGGVSSALTQIFEQHEESGEWWFLRDDQLRCKHGRHEETGYTLDSKLIANHYRYCNNFLWPLLHDLPQFVHYSEVERQAYRAFNTAIASRLKAARRLSSEGFFVNDYQFALIPNHLKGISNSFVFWHIPWPKHVLPQHSAALAEVAMGLLPAKVIGFHTAEYRDNFVRFIESYLPRFEVKTEGGDVVLTDRETLATHKLKLVAAPLGIDLANWNRLSGRAQVTRQSLSLPDLPYVLSVDRCDYTKGVRERLDAIDAFFSKHPDWQGKVFFLQLGTRSRPGLPEFDRYWQSCQRRLNALNARWATNDWQPLIWIDTPLVGPDLAYLYHHASVMLVNPLRDGLNLTAKEFVACQNALPGVLALSRGAGVWTEIGHGSVPVNPAEPKSFAGSLNQSLKMSETERFRRVHDMKVSMKTNSLASWWDTFKEACVASSLEPQLVKASGL